MIRRFEVKRIRNILEERGISQKQLANTVGVTPATLSRWITGETEPPALGIIAEMAKALNVSADYLLGMRKIKTAISVQFTLLTKIQAQVHCR